VSGGAEFRAWGIAAEPESSKTGYLEN